MGRSTTATTGWLSCTPARSPALGAPPNVVSRPDTSAVHPTRAPAVDDPAADTDGGMPKTNTSKPQTSGTARLARVRTRMPKDPRPLCMLSSLQVAGHRVPESFDRTATSRCAASVADGRSALVVVFVQGFAATQ